jgi:CRP-like cAMP-binding protein
MLDPSAFLADPDLIKALEVRSIAISCGEDYTIFRQGDMPAGLYILHRGVATLSMISVAGESVVSVQTTAGSLLGLPALVAHEPYTLTAVAQKDSELSFITAEDFNFLMRTDTSLSLKILQVLAAEVRAARQAILPL